MNCAKCNASVMSGILLRVNPVGEIGVWWCEPCIAKHEPELHRNNQEDESQVLRDLKEIFYGKKNDSDGPFK